MYLCSVSTYQKASPLFFSGACEAVYLCCDSIWFRSLSQQKHLNPTHLTLAQKGWCDVTCVRERQCATANARFGLFSLGPVFYFVGEWGSAQKARLCSELYPSFAFLPLTKNRQNSGQKIQLLAGKSKETQTHKLHTHTHTQMCPRGHGLEQIYARAGTHTHM